ncbi:MAG: hypothetical protein U5K69_07795 [Balneolaceae bacterium]|nr:hypothetical protein [Balneolaceae bacterium]
MVVLRQACQIALISSLLILGFSTIAHSQDINSIDFENLRASELSDQQIQRLWQRAQSQGYSISELEQMALARGMQPSQVSALVRRLRQIRMQGTGGQADTAQVQQLRTVTTDTGQIPRIQPGRNRRAGYLVQISSEAIKLPLRRH